MNATNIVPDNKMKTPKTSNIRFGLTLAFSLIALVSIPQSTEAQQFRTGVRLTVVQQPGRAYFNPVQQQYLLAMQQRQHALSNYGTAINLQASRLAAQRQQMESIQKAQQAYYQSLIHMQQVQQLRMQQMQQYRRR
ncbi:MAG: hypothetical protein VYD34_05240 [Verrucomicrobiota bacterium]|nr:hypothetical protein [Verrucomicrobiota bacterium]